MAIRRFRGSALLWSLLCSVSVVCADPPASIELAWIADGLGLVSYGDQEDYFYYAGGSVGDMNGDGSNDLVFGSGNADPDGRENAGEIYVAYGPFKPGVLDREDLPGGGLTVRGIAADDSVFVADSSEGCDVNGDGYDDLLAGSYDAEVSGRHKTGQSYVVFGSPVLPDVVELSQLDGNVGFAINGRERFDHASNIRCAGDVDADGFDDLLVGAQFAGQSGEVYLIFGESSFEPAFELADLNGQNGFALTNDGDGDEFGVSVSGAGDVNGDGYDDVVIGAEFAKYLGERVGAAYLIYGSNEMRRPDILGEARRVEAIGGVVLFGEKAFEHTGSDVDGGGDFNGDGYSDFIVGAWEDGSHGILDAGATYVVFGGPRLPSSIQLFDLDGSDGFAVLGVDPYDTLGNSIANFGDVNGDGYDDLATSAYYADPWGKEKAGESYVLFGGSNPMPATILADTLNGSNGFALYGEWKEDRAVIVGLVDLDGNGTDDLVSSAVLHDTGATNAGAGYVTFAQEAPAVPVVLFEPQTQPLDPVRHELSALVESSQSPDPVAGDVSRRRTRRQGTMEAMAPPGPETSTTGERVP